MFRIYFESFLSIFEIYLFVLARGGERNGRKLPFPVITRNPSEITISRGETSPILERQIQLTSDREGINFETSPSPFRQVDSSEENKTIKVEFPACAVNVDFTLRSRLTRFDLERSKINTRSW